MKMKQTFALLCAGAMVITGSAFPVNVQASADWVWNEEVSESGYKKVPYTELTTTADTEADNESSTGEGAASPGTGHAVNATDGVITSYYHSCYSGDNQPNREDGALTGNNTITVELQNAQSIQGITYLPRQDAFGNGTVTEFSVSVQKDGTENWENVGNNLHISYNNPGANWSAENKSEKEFVFDAEVENVKKVKLTVIHTDGSAPNQHISAAEISILTPVKKDAETEALKIRIREKLAQMESQMELNVLSGNADSGKVYSRAKFDPIKAEAEAKLAQESTTKEELEAVFQQLEQFKMEFQDELGTGVYVSDLTHLSGNTAWGGVKKDLCPDGNRLIAIKKDTSTINTYTKGIGAHEPSSIVYDVTGYKMFSADIGVENHQIASDGGVFANVKAKFKVSTSTDGSNYTQQYYAEDLSANGGLRSIRVKLPEATRKALEDDLADAKAAKDNTALSVEEVKLIVESLKTSIEGLQLKAVVTINNNGNTETKYCEVGDQVRVVAAQAPEGKKFSHWTVNEKPICYNESYTFTVYKDIAVTSVYVEEAEEIQKEVSVLCDVSYANGRVKFLSKYSVPTDADYKVIKAGVVATDSTGYAAIQEVQQELTLDTTATTRLKKYGVNTDLYLANFTQYLKTSRTTTWYARGYVTYQDNSGEQHTVYSDMAQYTIR